jgi:hypothetical protein
MLMARSGHGFLLAGDGCASARGPVPPNRLRSPVWYPGLELNWLSGDQAWRWLTGQGVDAAEIEDALGQSGPDAPDPVAFVPAEPVSRRCR